MITYRISLVVLPLYCYCYYCHYIYAHIYYDHYYYSICRYHYEVAAILIITLNE